MIRSARSRCFPALAAAIFALGAQTAASQELFGAREKANQICASYGPGFVAGSAPGQCVRVQERLRVEPHARRAALDEYAPVYSSASDGPMRDRLRLNGGFGATAR